MKKAIIVVMAIVMPFVFTSCSKDDADDAKYVFKYTAEDSGTVDITITLFEYTDEKESVGMYTFEAYNGLVEEFTAKPNAGKVKVYIRMTGGSTNLYRWVQQVYYLHRGGSIDIEITDKTMLGSNEP